MYITLAYLLSPLQGIFPKMSDSFYIVNITATLAFKYVCAMLAIKEVYDFRGNVGVLVS
jgi:hypothetical protein